MLKSRQRRAWRRQLVKALLGGWVGQPRHLNAKIGSPPKTIAIIRPNHRLGNILMLTPLIDAIEKQWPDAQVDVIGGGRLDDIFKAFPSVRDCIQAPQPAVQLLWHRSFRKRLHHRYDVAINIEPESQSAKLIAKIVDAPSTVVPTSHHSAHMAIAPIAALSDCLPAPLGPPWPRLSLRLSEQEKHQGKARLATTLSLDESSVPLIGLYPFANKGRNYSPSWWTALITSLRQAMPQAHLIEILPAHSERLLRDADGHFLALDLRDFAARLSALDAVIASDGGVMHLASASGALTWGLFKVTDPKVYAPYGGENRAWSQQEAEPHTLATSLKNKLID